MKLTHFSSEPLAKGVLKDVPEQPTRDAVKPSGLWVSCDGEHDWEWWCKAEQFNLGRYTLKQEIILEPGVLRKISDTAVDGGVLHLGAPRDLDRFQRLYGKALRGGVRDDWIAWEKVSQIWDGVIIDPYIWERRMTMIWYYGWDCASGCLWRPARVIASVGDPVSVDWTPNRMLTEE